MGDPIYIINCTWNVRGKVTAAISSGSFGDAMTDSLRLFSPSVLMLVSHQLGTFLPATGLSLTSHLINYVVSGQNLVLPINNALKGVKLEFMRRSQGGTAIQFKPETGWLAKSENIEDSARVFL